MGKASRPKPLRRSRRTDRAFGATPDEADRAALWVGTDPEDVSRAAARHAPRRWLFVSGRPRATVPDRLAAVAGSALFALVAGAVLWPPGAVYWTALAAVVGDGPTLALVALLGAAAGGAFVRATGVSWHDLARGALAAYVVGMTVVEVGMDPDSPVHLVGYGALAACLVGGGALARWSASRE